MTYDHLLKICPISDDVLDISKLEKQIQNLELDSDFGVK